MSNHFFALDVLISYNTSFKNKMTNKIEFTETAKKEINRIISQDASKKYFRISVLGGGCSGFKYNFSFENKINDNDNLFDQTVIDNSSLKIIEGSIVDFKKELIGNSFSINNPKANSSCGCGLSFSV
tara:strand:+ start:4093 stop:4473 length:381 start_codon:yes stop_codon:yes gene_type:complete